MYAIDQTLVGERLETGELRRIKAINRGGVDGPVPRLLGSVELLSERPHLLRRAHQLLLFGPYLLLEDVGGLV